MTTPQGLAVEAAHDAAQARLLDRGLAELTLAWTSLIDPRDLDASSPLYLDTATAVVERTRGEAALVARDFYGALRATETADLPEVEAFSPILPESPPTAATRTSLAVQGPVAVKRGIGNGLILEEALSQALSMTLGAATRIVEGGPRDVARVNAVADPDARGWMRRSGGVPCSFCAMLISRGPAYASEGSASFRAHDHCHCKATVFWAGDTGWTAQAAEFKEMWETAKRSKGKVTFEEIYRSRYPKTVSPADVRDEAYRSQRARKAAETRRAKKAQPDPAPAEPLAPVVDLDARRRVPSLADVPEHADVAALRDTVETQVRLLKEALGSPSLSSYRRRQYRDLLEWWEPYDKGLTRFAPATARVEALPKYPPGLVDDLTGDDFVQLTNPLYQSDPRARINCVHVANTYELQRRGYAVTATPLPTRLGDSGRDSQEALLRWRDRNGDARVFSETTTRRLTRDVSAWPVGARGFVTVQWKSGGGHIFNVERTADGVRYYEAQSRTRIDFDSDYAKAAKMNSVRVARVDDLTPSDAVLEFVQEGADEWQALSTFSRLAIEYAAL